MNSEEELINSAINSYNSGNYETSLINYNKITELYPDSKEAYYNKGIVLQKMNKYQESLESFGKSLEIENDFIPSLLGKALSLSIMNDKDNSLKIYDQIISLDEKNWDAYINKATILSELKKYDEALDCLDKLEKINLNEEIDNNEQSINIFNLEKKDIINFIKGNILHQKGELNKAVELYNVILGADNNKNNEQVLINKGICLLELNKLD